MWKINFDYTLYVTRMFRLYPLFSEFFKRIFELITTYPYVVWPKFKLPIHGLKFRILPTRG